MNTNQEQADYIYYNINIKPDTTGRDTEAIYEINKTNPVLKHTEKYELAVTRFKIPSDSIPIFFFKQNYFYVTIQKDAEIQTIALQYIPSTNPSNASIYGKDGVWTVYEFIDIINKGLLDAYNNLIDKGTTSEAPFIVFDSKTRLCSLYCEQIFPSENFKIYFNDALFDKFPSFQSFYNRNEQFRAFEIIVKNNYTNTTVYNTKQFFIMEQSYETINKWSMVTRILFRTSMIPVNPEIEGDILNKTESIITDYEPIEGEYDKNAYYYDGGNEYRFVDLINTSELRGLNLRLFWKDIDGDVYPFYLNTHNPLSVKILFRKKLINRLQNI